MFGSLEFSILSKKYGIQPIIGVVLTIRYLFNQQKNKSNLGDIVLLTQNNIGYFNLIEIITEYYINNKENVKYSRMSSLLLKSKGLIIICGQYGSPLEKLFYTNMISLSYDLSRLLKYTFNKNRKKWCK